jgi:hypothetical protein
VTTKAWEVLYRDKTIRVMQQRSWLPPGTTQSLEVEGLLVCQRTNAFLPVQSYLTAPIETSEGVQQIEAFIGNSGLGLVCNIYVDGQRVEGDSPKDLQATTLQQWHAIRDKGLLRFLLLEGILKAGLFYAVGMFLFNALGLFGQYGVGQIASMSVFFGLVMGGHRWWSYKTTFEGYD